MYSLIVSRIAYNVQTKCVCFFHGFGKVCANMDMIGAVKTRIMKLCDERNISINKLATLSAVAPSSIKNILYGKSVNPKLLTIKMLCDGLDITLAEFFDCPEFNDDKV